MVSRSFRDLIVTHFLLSKKRLIETFDEIRKTNEESQEIANDLGLLVKRATFTYPIGERIKLITRMFETVHLRDQLRLVYAADKTAFKSLIKSIRCLFTTLIRGWELKEVLKLLELYFDYSRLINHFLRHEYGAIREDEQFLRYFYRKIIFEGLEENRSRARWLSYFLDYHTKFTSDSNVQMTYKAKLVLLLFSPVFQEDSTGVVYVDWLAYSSNFFIDECLNYLGFAFKLLNSLRTPAERGLDIAHLFLTVTNIGRYWLYENSSALLLYCGANVAKQIVDWLLKREDYLHLIRYLTHLFIVEGNLVVLDKIAPSQRITEPIFEHLKRSMNVLALDNILDMISIEFLRAAREIERVSDEREYLSAYQIAFGQKQFYELIMRKWNSISESGIATGNHFYDDLI